jgi:tRNA U38,U39,U40 pseudouridine synthase TruA
MYFTPILITDLKKGPYFIVENHYWCNDVKMYYIAEISSPHSPRYTTLTNVYEYMNPIKKIKNQIQLETASLCFFKMVPTILPKLKQRMLDQILQNITGDTTFTYPIFEPDELHYFLKDNKLKNNMFPIKHVK